MAVSLYFSSPRDPELQEFARILHGTGIHTSVTSTAEGTEQALRVLQRCVAVVDGDLPPAEGFRVYSYLQNLLDTPFIMLTPNGRAGSIVRNAAGELFETRLVKPVTAEMLTQAVVRMLGHLPASSEAVSLPSLPAQPSTGPSYGGLAWDMRHSGAAESFEAQLAVTSTAAPAETAGEGSASAASGLASAVVSSAHVLETQIERVAAGAEQRIAAWAAQVLQEAEGRAREIAFETERHMATAEIQAGEAEHRRSLAEQRMRDAERRVAEAEHLATDAEQRLTEADELFQARRGEIREAESKLWMLRAQMNQILATAGEKNRRLDMASTAAALQESGPPAEEPSSWKDLPFAFGEDDSLEISTPGEGTQAPLPLPASQHVVYALRAQSLVAEEAAGRRREQQERAAAAQAERAPVRPRALAAVAALLS